MGLNESDWIKASGNAQTRKPRPAPNGSAKVSPDYGIASQVSMAGSLDRMRRKPFNPSNVTACTATA